MKQVLHFNKVIKFVIIFGEDVYKRQPVLHTELRTTADAFRFQFQLDNRNCLMHLCNQPQGLLIVFRIGKDVYKRQVPASTTNRLPTPL